MQKSARLHAAQTLQPAHDPAYVHPSNSANCNGEAPCHVTSKVAHSHVTSKVAHSHMLPLWRHLTAYRSLHAPAGDLAHLLVPHRCTPCHAHRMQVSYVRSAVLDERRVQRALPPDLVATPKLWHKQMVRRLGWACG